MKKAKGLSKQQHFYIVEFTDKGYDGKSTVTYYRDKDSRIRVFVSTEEAEERVLKYLVQEPLNPDRRVRVIPVAVPPNRGVYLPQRVFYATFEGHTSFHNKYVKVIAKDEAAAALTMRDHFAHRWGDLYEGSPPECPGECRTELCTITAEVSKPGGSLYSLREED